MVKMRKAELEDAKRLAPNLREEDKLELRSVYTEEERSLEDIIKESIDLSIPALAVEEDGNVIMVFGASDYGDPECGLIWLLGSDAIKRLWLPFLKQSHYWMNAMFNISKKRLLFNRVCAKNELHVRWIKWLGFTFVQRLDNYGHLGLPFYEFCKLKG
ncbi:hypothetical protein EBU71_09980 [bacterium]|nr:hypothetical protein [Candidatus Elulimicrobium humile]